MGHSQTQAIQLNSRIGNESCICCGSSKSQLRPTSDPRFQLRRCCHCGTASTVPFPSPEELEKHYDQSYYGLNNVKFIQTIERMIVWINRRRAMWIHHRIPSHSQILEIGCGRGLLLGALRRLQHECQGIERSDLAASAAKRLGVPIQTVSLEDCAFQDESFDAIVLWHVLEHLNGLSENLTSIQRILKPGGMLFLEVPNFSSWQAVLSGCHWFHLDIPRHLFHFSSNGLAKLLKRYGFEVEEWTTFSMEQCPFGVLQSLLNTMSGAPDILYRQLKREISLPPGRVFLQLLLAGILLIPTILFSLLESTASRGGVLRVVAKKSFSPTIG
jgi:SAM-dependent methyltransferase